MTMPISRRYCDEQIESLTYLINGAQSHYAKQSRRSPCACGEQTELCWRRTNPVLFCWESISQLGQAAWVKMAARLGSFEQNWEVHARFTRHLWSSH
jgi:hypothetical protein